MVKSREHEIIDLWEVLMEEVSEKKQGKVISFLKKHWILIGILLITLITRIIYFNINSAIWYDEGEYLSMAKHWSMDLPFRLGPQRMPFFPFLASILMNAGFNEAALRFAIVALPSIGVVFLTYLLGKEMYDKKIGLIASFLMSVFWVILFNVTRFHTDLLAFFSFSKAVNNSFKAPFPTKTSPSERTKISPFDSLKAKFNACGFPNPGSFK